MDSEIQSKGGAQEAGRSSLHEVLAAVERLRDRWADRADYMENLAGYDGDAMAQLNKHHAKIIRTCISELYQEVKAANHHSATPVV